MSTVQSNKVTMQFLREDAKSKSFSIADYNTDATDAQIKASAQGIIDEDIFVYDGCGLAGIKKIQRIHTTTTDVDLS